MDGLNLRGWLPIRIWQVAGAWTVDWCWFGDRPLRQPFFREAVEEALRLPFNQAFRRQTPLAVLSQWRQHSPGVAPSAFIYHASRCGSTLVSQMLAHLDEYIVVSEPPPLDALLRAPLAAAERTAALRGLLSAYGQVRTGVERRLVIKLDAWNIGELPLLRQCFAETPWLFLYRDPLEIAVSHLRRAGMHMIPGLLGPCALDDEEPFRDRESWMARRLGRLLALGLEHCRAWDGRALNYSELPGAMDGDLGDFFGLNADQRRAAFERVGMHAKQPAQAFIDDRQGKRAEASAWLREQLAQWAQAPYLALERWRGEAAGQRVDAGVSPSPSPPPCP